MTPPKLYIYQIFYDHESQKALDPEAIPLDNTNGPPDWYEFWPILNFLRNNELEEDSFYAFLSPSFSTKTGFSLTEVKSIAARERARDVIVFSSFWTSLIRVRNPWLQGENKHPGLLRRAQGFFDAIGVRTDLANVWTDSTTAAFSNYLVAKPAYWREWHRLAEQYYAFVESQDPNGSHQEVTDYRGERSVQYKVFIQERLSSHVLLTNNFDVIMPDHPFLGDPPADPERLRALLVRIDQQKRRYRESENPADLLRLKWLGIIYDHAKRSGTSAEWAFEWFLGKVRRATTLAKR